MDVKLELRPIEWTGSQGSTGVDDEWILLYSISDGPEYNTRYQVLCELVDCPKLAEKYGLKTKHAFSNPEGFETLKGVKCACEAHYRELMLKAFVQAV